MKNNISSPLLGEEKRATRWFLFLFYIVFFTYEIIYNQLVLNLPWLVEQNPNLLNYLSYFILLALIPYFIHRLKINRFEKVKYILFYTFLGVSLVSDLLYHYWNPNVSYNSGNIAEMAVILFSPIFVNRKFFFTLVIGIILKYFIVFLFLFDPIVFFPISLIIVIGGIAYIILHRFISYVNALENSFDQKLDGIVRGIITTLELKDPYTRGHSERVAQYALKLAKETNKFNENSLKYFYYTCLLHDIGKVNIPDAILIKPGRLTEEEYEVIKQHPVTGAEAVKEVEGIADYIDIIKHHHERWDGKGYPSGLSKDNIPYAARITAIADAFDAMTSNRSYRSALSVEEAYKRIIEGSGTHFDPNLVELFKKVFPSWVEYKKLQEETSQDVIPFT